MLNFYCQRHFQTRHTPLILRRVKVIKKQVINFGTLWFEKEFFHFRV